MARRGCSERPAHTYFYIGGPAVRRSGGPAVRRSGVLGPHCAIVANLFTSEFGNVVRH
jgi:hypothetical protein